MAEKRMISKVISISKKVNLRLKSHFSRLLYTWMIPHTDDFGRMPGCPHKVKALVIPMLDESWKEVEQALQELHENKLIHLYEIQGEMYVQIINFEEHQQGLHKRTKSKFPEFPGNSGKFQEIPSEENRTEENGREGNGREQNGTAPPVPTFDGQHKDKILAWLNKYNVDCKGIAQLEEISSYFGRVDIEVIELCIKKAEKQHVPYAISIIERHIREKKTTKESILPKVGELNEKSQGQLQHEQSAPEDKPITNGAVGALPSKWASKVVQMPQVSG